MRLPLVVFDRPSDVDVLVAAEPKAPRYFAAGRLPDHGARLRRSRSPAVDPRADSSSPVQCHERGPCSGRSVGRVGEGSGLSRGRGGRRASRCT